MASLKAGARRRGRPAKRKPLSVQDADRELRLRHKASEAMAKAFKRKKGALPAAIVAMEMRRADALAANFLEPAKDLKPEEVLRPGEFAPGRQRQISPTNILFLACPLNEWFTIDALARRFAAPGDKLKPFRVNLYFEVTKWRRLGLAEMAYGDPEGKGLDSCVYRMPVRLVAGPEGLGGAVAAFVKANPWLMLPQARTIVWHAEKAGLVWALWKAGETAGKRGSVEGKARAWRYVKRYKRYVEGMEGMEGRAGPACYPFGCNEPEKKPGLYVVDRSGRRAYRPGGFRAARPGVSVCEENRHQD